MCSLMSLYKIGIPGLVITLVGAGGVLIGHAYSVMGMEIAGYIVTGLGGIGMAYSGYTHCHRPRTYTNTVEINPVQSSMKRNKSDTDLQLISGEGV